MLSLVKSLITGTPHSLLFWLTSPDGELFIVPPSPRVPAWLSGCLAEGKYTIPMFTVHDWELLLRWDLLSSLQGQGLFLKQLLPLSQGVSLLTTCNSLQLEPDLSVQRAVGELRGEATATSSAELDFQEYLADSGDLQATLLVLADSAPDVTVLQTSSSPACYGFAFLWAAGSVGAAWEEHLQLLRNATASGLLVDLCTCLCVSVRMWSQNHHLTECAHSLWNFRCILNVHVVSSWNRTEAEHGSDTRCKGQRI